MGDRLGISVLSDVSWVERHGQDGWLGVTGAFRGITREVWEGEVDCEGRSCDIKARGP